METPRVFVLVCLIVFQVCVQSVLSAPTSLDDLENQIITADPGKKPDTPSSPSPTVNGTGSLYPTLPNGTLDTNSTNGNSTVSHELVF